jgi:hypothetical protein
LCATAVEPLPDANNTSLLQVYFSPRQSTTSQPKSV